MTSHDNVTDIVGRLQDVYGKLTPGAIERADLDGMAFTVADAITDLATLRKQLENAREALIQADLTIRSFKGTDQSDVEFIREALAALGPLPAPPTIE